MSFLSPHYRCPTHLVAERDYSPALAVWGAGVSVQVGVSTVVVTVGDSSISVTYSDRTPAEVAAEISSSGLGCFARYMSDGPTLSNGELFHDGETSSDGGFVVRRRGHMVQYSEETQVRLLAPYSENRLLPWYPRLDRGNVVMDVGGARFLFGVPEYGDQEWSTYFGAPFVDVVGERPNFVGKKTLRVARTPVFWERGNMVLLVDGAPVSGSVIKDVDENNGLVYLVNDLRSNARLSISYTYREDSFVYRGIDLNPTYQHNPAVLDQTVLIYLVPISSSLGRTRSSGVRHAVFRSLRGGIASLRRDDEPVLVLGAYNVRAVGNKNEVAIRDARALGGGVDEEKWDDALLKTEGVRSIADLGRWDGVPFPGSCAAVVVLPTSLRDQYGTAVVEGRIKKHVAVGGNVLVEYE